MTSRRFIFIGVTTRQSSVNQVFPRWRDRLRLGADVELIGCDLPLHAPPETYRKTVLQIRDDPRSVGALVTTHKMDLFAAAHDLFDKLDSYAQLLSEVSCIAREDGQLLGRATDPISSGWALADFLESGYFQRTGGQVLCFGAGGAAHAITLHFLTERDPADRPSRLVVTDSNPERLDHLRSLVDALHAEIPVECVHSRGPLVHDTLLHRMPPGSLIINATGMGKDLPGSPLTDRAIFPTGSIAWDLNYRGELLFLRQAAAQRDARRVRVEDGWRYFVFGWAAVMEGVFHRPISREEMELLAADAAFARPHDSPALKDSYK